MDITAIIVGFVGLIYYLTFAYFCWLKPDAYINFTRSRQKKTERSFRYRLFRPCVEFLQNHSTIDLFGVRIASLFGIIVSLGMIFVGIHGPIR